MYITLLSKACWSLLLLTEAFQFVGKNLLSNQKQKEIKFKPRIELNHFISTLCFRNPLKNIRSVLLAVRK